MAAAHQCLPNNETRDRFAAEFSLLGRIWEALSPDPCLKAYEKDYRWLSQVYESVRPVNNTGKLLWHRLGAKTIELINQHTGVDGIKDDTGELILDAELLDSVLKSADGRKAKEIEIQLIARLRKHGHDPKFQELGERLERIRQKHEEGLITSLEFLKGILEIARDTVEAEKRSDPKEEQDKAKSALTELFNEAKNKSTHIIVEDIDKIVKNVRFDGWQATAAGERQVKQALRA